MSIVLKETLGSYLNSIKGVDIKSKMSHLTAAVEALGQIENDIDALDCLAQIISTANTISRSVIVKLSQEKLQ